MEIVRIPVLNDNYVWLVHEPASGETMVVDPAVAGPVLETLAPFCCSSFLPTSSTTSLIAFLVL